MACVARAWAGRVCTGGGRRSAIRQRHVQSPLSAAQTAPLGSRRDCRRLHVQTAALVSRLHVPCSVAGGDLSERCWQSVAGRALYVSVHRGSDQQPQPTDAADWDPLQQLWPETLDGSCQRLLLLHVHQKWGGGRRQSAERQQLLVAEAEALVRSLSGWSVVQTVIQPVLNPRTKAVLGSGQLERLRRTLGKLPAVTGVLVNVEQLSAIQHAQLEAALGRPVLDRYGLVLRIFRQHASSQAAKLQVALAQIPYQRARLRTDAGGTPLWDARRQQLEAHERRVRAALQRLEGRRQLLRAGRAQRAVPTVGVVGYTNAGKTTLIGALSAAGRLRGRDQLFATLDVTVHRAAHQRLRHVLLDTVGFMHHLPTALIDGFRATLAEVASAHLLLHVVDLSHPDRAAQAEHVMSTLRRLQLPQRLLDSVITVGTKSDLVTGDGRQREPGASGGSAQETDSDSELSSDAFGKNSRGSTRDSLGKDSDGGDGLLGRDGGGGGLQSSRRRDGGGDRLPADLLRVSAVTGAGLLQLRQLLEQRLSAAAGRLTAAVRCGVGGATYSHVLRHCDVLEQRQSPEDPQTAEMVVLVTPAQLAALRRALPGVRVSVHDQQTDHGQT